MPPASGMIAEPCSSTGSTLIAKAFEVLSNPAQREFYDYFGKSELLSTEVLDPSDVLRFIFGGKKFDLYIGQLRLVSVLSVDENLSGDALKKKMKDVQGKREEVLSKFLIDKLTSKADDNDFKAFAYDEVAKLKVAGYGVNLLHIIGCMYVTMAVGKRRKEICLGIPAIVDWFRSTCHYTQSQVTALRAACGLVKLRRKIQKKLRIGQRCSDKLAKDMKTEEEMMIASLWKLIVADIEVTLWHVCQMVLEDQTASKEVIGLRVKRLKELGKIFKRGESPVKPECRPSRQESPVGEAPRRPSREESPAGEAPCRPSREESPAGEAPRRPSREESPAGEAPRRPSKEESPAGQATRQPSREESLAGQATSQPSREESPAGEAKRGPSPEESPAGEAETSAESGGIIS